MIMRKKILLCVAVFASCMMANAQGLLLKKSPMKAEAGKSLPAPMMRAEAPSDYIQWGYADAQTPLNKWSYVGIQGQTLEMHAAYKVDGAGILKGAKIAAIDIPCASYVTKNVTVWVRESLDGTNIASKTYTGSIEQGTFKQIVLDSPVAIPETGLYVGYTAASADGIAITGETAIKNSLFLKIGSEPWEDYYDAGWGSLLMQIEVTDVNLPENTATFSQVDGALAQVSSTANIVAYVANESSTAISSIDYTIDVDGVKSQKHIDFTTPIAAGFAKQAIDIEFTTPAEIKDYQVKLNIDKVNGAENSLKDKVTVANCSNLLRKAVRRTVVEELTGTGCPWCTRGWAGMETMKEKYPDTFIGVAYHQYNQSDPMYIGFDYPNYCSGAPQCTMDRTLGQIDPFFGSGNYTDITGDFDVLNAILPSVDVTVDGSFTADGNAVDANATVEYLTNSGDYSVAFVLTADKVTGEGQSWMQANNYASYSVVNAGAEGTLLADFCRGGKYGQTYVTLVFNDVQIASSYKSSQNQADALTGEVAAGNKAQTSYQLSLPTSRTKLMEAINRDEIYVVALVIDNTTGKIANAARAKVGGSTGITSIDGDSANATEVARYTIDGRQTSAPVKGINLVKMSDGRIMKVINK